MLGNQCNKLNANRLAVVFIEHWHPDSYGIPAHFIFIVAHWYNLK